MGKEFSFTNKIEEFKYWDICRAGDIQITCILSSTDDLTYKESLNNEGIPEHSIHGVYIHGITETE